MNVRLVEIMEKEVKLLKSLLNLLKEQYNLLIDTNKYVVKISQMSEDMNEIVKKIANLELEKKQILQGNKLSEFVNSCGEEYISNIYSETLELLDAIAIQKDNNRLFIKQQLFFTKSMIRAITPKKNAEIYDNAGKIIK